MNEPVHDKRAGTVLGWLAGGALALLLDYGLASLVGPSYPTGITTFVLLAAFMFGGMAVADRLGPKAVRILGPVAGVLVAVVLVVLAGIALGPGDR
ncbi:MAG: hypothetical protein U0230_08135 [Polyangiales bacterium]